MLKTPVLFLIFNRPEYTKKVFEQIRSAQPIQLFIAADGPRYPIKNDYNLCQQARSIAQKIDWPCEVKTLFRNHNLGCGRGVSDAISWFFEHVESGIILEDDCLASDDFFQFCTLGLEQFKHDTSVMMLTGTNYHFGYYQYLEGFYRSKFYAIWGWATWRRAWLLYSYNISDWQIFTSRKDLNDFFGNKLIAERYAKFFDDIKNGSIDTWDGQWVLACVKNQGLSISLTTNMIANIGHIGSHSNGTVSPFHSMPYQKNNIEKSLKKELSVRKSIQLDMDIYKKIGFLYKDPMYKIWGRSLKNKFPILKKIYEFIKNH